MILFNIRLSIYIVDFHRIHAANSLHSPEIIILEYTQFYLFLLLESFSHRHLLMVFQWSLSDTKSHQVSRTLLSILADLCNAVVWIVSTHPVISESFCPFTNPLVTVPRAPFKIGTTVTFMFHSLFVFFNSLAISRYLYFFSLSFNFTLWSAGKAKSTILQVLFFFLFFFFIIIRLFGRN